MGDNFQIQKKFYQYYLPFLLENGNTFEIVINCALLTLPGDPRL